MGNLAVAKSIDKMLGDSFFNRLQGIKEYQSYSQDDIEYLSKCEALLKNKRDQFSILILNEFTLKLQVSLSSLIVLLVENSFPQEEEFMDDENKIYKEVRFKIIEKPGHVIEDALDYTGYKYASFQRIVKENLSSKAFFDMSDMG